MNPRWLLLVAFVVLDVHGGETRMWTNTSGQIVEAEMTGVNTARRAVQVRLKDGTAAEILIENLSPPDKEYAKQQWARMQSGAPASAAPAPAPAAANGSNPSLLAPRFVHRVTADSRLAKILESGGTAEVEASVIRSLDKFKTSQNPDGSWGRSNKGAMTGFALQCFYGHGETPDSPVYGDAMVKGLLYLIQLGKQNPHGMLSEGWEANKGGGGCYEHAIATVAVAEAYLMARGGSKSLPGLRECFDTALKLIISRQNKKGSWTYGGKDDTAYNAESTGGDLSLANWHFLALEIARETHLKIDGLDSCIKNAKSYIGSTQSKDGGFGGDNRENHYNQWSLSGGAITGLHLLTGQGNGDTKKAVKFLAEFLAAEPPLWDKNCNLYSWHGYASALLLEGGTAWKTFASQVLPQIVAAQDADGSFKRGKPSWPASDAADATYRQALCTLILETPYRCAR